MVRIARSLDVLRSEANAAAPRRSKASDGWIGDAAHSSRASRHNPNNAGVVCALDLTHDPAGGCDIHVVARRLVARLAGGGSSNPCFEYVISEQQIASRSSGWIWRPYTGTNPHTRHAHFAVGRGPDAAPAQPYDDQSPWHAFTDAPPPPPPPADDFKERVMALPILRQGATGQYVRNMQGLLNANGEPMKIDGDFGPATDRGLRAWQRRAGLSNDGICGRNTWSRLVGV